MRGAFFMACASSSAGPPKISLFFPLPLPFSLFFSPWGLLFDNHNGNFSNFSPQYFLLNYSKDFLFYVYKFNFAYF